NTSIDAVTYEWDFGDNTPGSTEFEPTHFFPDWVDGEANFNVTLVAYNELGCPDTANHVITVEDILIFYVPNVFTPDGDNINNTFFPVFTAGFDYYDYHLMIFNRWGEVVFESYNSDVGWDGTYGDGGLVQDGVYIWQIKFGETGTDKKRTVRGHVTVLK
ncbi:MAG: gliding motility-associated C-terminal domain-containing protein, partial [Crocinitomicaceae bacterium]